MRLSYLWYLGAIIFVIPIIYFSKDDTNALKPVTHQMSDTNNVYDFFPNEQCTTVAYFDTVNCGNSIATLVSNPQNYIWCKLTVSKVKMHKEPFAGIEIWLKDPKNMKDISNYDYIEIIMNILNSDSSNGQFNLHSHSRLKHPENLPSKDTLPCDDPRKGPNNRYNFSVKLTDIPVRKNISLYTIDLSSFRRPDWYFNNGSTYVEDFDNKRFYSLCLQTGSNFPLNKEYYVIISSIRFKKNIQIQPIVNSTKVQKNHPLILVFLIISCILYLFIVAMLTRNRIKDNTVSNKFTGDNKSSKGRPVPEDTSYGDTTSLLPPFNYPPDSITPDTTQISSTTPLPLNEMTSSVLIKIAENPKLTTDDLARTCNRDSSTLGKKFSTDFGNGITISKLRLYFTALEIRNNVKSIATEELYEHANRKLTDTHGKLANHKELQKISVILQQKCTTEILETFKTKYGDNIYF